MRRSPLTDLVAVVEFGYHTRKGSCVKARTPFGFRSRVSRGQSCRYGRKRHGRLLGMPLLRSASDTEGVVHAPSLMALPL